MRYDFSMVAGIRNPLLRALAAMAIVASPVLVAFAALGGFALLWSLSVVHGL